MVKAASKMDDGRYLVVLGLALANVRRLKQHDPILFDLSSLELPSLPVLLAWKTNDGKVASVKDFQGMLIAFSSKALRQMRSNPLIIEDEQRKFIISVYESQAVADAAMRGFCGPLTKILEPRL